ncbi:MAG: hypothetical protein KFF73_15460 [Cyclobacteriaceae bacterium]|nr:hypothetical protein [Cyclobacteriaceae bacterium]
MNENLIEIVLYLLGGAFLFLLLMYVFKTRTDRQFREKMVPLLKKQKSTIDKLEKERDEISQRHTEMKKELNILKNQLAIQDTEYGRINFILDKGMFSRFRIPSVSQEVKDQPEVNSPEGDLLFAQQVNAIEQWFGFKYLKKIPDAAETEVTVILQRLSQILNSEYSYKKLNFVCHLGEPIHIRMPEEVFEYISLTFGRLIGKRSVNGNTLYFDTDKTGKKCLISLEDSGPGDNDPALKSLLSETWAPNKLPELPDQSILPVIVAKELIHVFQGNTWYSRIHEIGMKITFSIPILIK